jgi:hypothetical protein
MNTDNLVEVSKSSPKQMMTREKAFEFVKELKVNFGGAEQFILTGSLVATLQGFGNNFNDFDVILVNPSPSTIELLTRHVKENPSCRKSEDLMSKGVFLFRYLGNKVDVFIQHTKYDAKLQYDGIILSPLMELIKAKQSFHRLKDYMQLREWSKMIQDPTNVFDELELIRTTEEYNK